MSLNKKNLALFLTYGMSLKKWQEIGMYEREIDIYLHLSKKFNHIFIFSYGNQDINLFKNKLPDNILIIEKKIKIPKLIYQLILPFLHIRTIKDCYILKTNQIYGSIPAIISKILFPSAKLVIRSGYIASLNAKLYKTNILNRIYTNTTEWLAYRFCNIAIIPTQENAKYLVSKYKFLQSKLKVINNSIRTDIFKPIDHQKKFDIGYVGRLNKDKNLLTLLKAIKKLNLSLCFIGQGKEKKALLTYASNHRINLTIIDKVNNFNLPIYYNKFKIFAFPSFHEGNPKTLLEAMSCGLPVIGCDVVGINNIIKHEQNGILTKTDINSIKNAILSLLSKKEKQNSLGQQARQFILDNYSHEVIYKKEIKIYETINW